MDDLIAISRLNDFIFCPYSIYLHQVYMEADENVYHAKPQVAGRNAHESVDQKRTRPKSILIESLPGISHELGVYGKIDTYRADTRSLIERKLNLKQIFRGQIYQLWAQYFCMLEMGYEVKNISFYEISTKTSIPQELPTTSDKNELISFIASFRQFDLRTFEAQTPYSLKTIA